MGSKERERVAVGAAAGIAATWVMTKIARTWAATRFPEDHLHYHPLTNLRWAVRTFGGGAQVSDEWEMPLAHLLHYGYGAVAGAAYATQRGGQRTTSVSIDGPAYGLLLWTISFCGYVPLLGIYEPAWKFEPPEREITLVAHTSYGVALAALVKAYDRARH